MKKLLLEITSSFGVLAMGGSVLVPTAAAVVPSRPVPFKPLRRDAEVYAYELKAS